MPMSGYIILAYLHCTCWTTDCPDPVDILQTGTSSKGHAPPLTYAYVKHFQTSQQQIDGTKRLTDEETTSC